LVVGFDDRFQKVLLDSPRFLASFVRYLHSKSHKFVPKEDSLKHLFGSKFVRNEFLLPEKLNRIFVSVEGVKEEDQELEHYLHLDLVSDHNIQVFVFELDCETVPLKLWKHLINEFWVVFLERRYDLKDALPLHPEPSR
tara:strand:+ start:505 stop:921 length:417 start_codon:yes stop_codon:yes gene_type:complete